MRKIRDVLRLSAAGMSERKIAASLAVSATASPGPLPEELSDEGLVSFIRWRH
jgi:hypothetical protein